MANSAVHSNVHPNAPRAPDGFSKRGPLGLQPVGLDESQRYMRLEDSSKLPDLGSFPHLLSSVRVTSLPLLHE